MKTKKASIGMLAGLFLLSFTVVSQAALSPNLLSNSDFETGLTTISSGNLSSGKWYISNDLNNWTRLWSSSNGWYATMLNLHERHLFQSVSINSAWPGHTATAGEVKVSFDYKAFLGQSWALPGAFTVTVYGSNSQPTVSNFTNGIVIGTITGLGSIDTWTTVSRSFMADAGYAWYTIDVFCDLNPGLGRYLNIDNVSLQVTPIPAAAWLLGTGLIGLIGIRRRFTN